MNATAMSVYGQWPGPLGPELLLKDILQDHSIMESDEFVLILKRSHRTIALDGVRGFNSYRTDMSPFIHNDRIYFSSASAPEYLGLPELHQHQKATPLIHLPGRTG